jgi:hypothetical protein
MNSRSLYFAIHGERPKRRSPRARRRGPARDWRYLAWIRSLPCLLCGCKAEAAHTGNDGGTSQKASDYSAVPLCHHCHQSGQNSYHKLTRGPFEAFHNVNLAGLVRRLTSAWFAHASEVK